MTKRAKALKRKPISSLPPAVPQPQPTRSEVGLRSAPDFVREIEEFPARLLAELPLPVTLQLELPGAPAAIWLTTAEVFEDEPALGARVLFSRDELVALVRAVEADRMWRKELLVACFEKWRRPALRMSERDALAQAMPDDSVEPWSVGQVLRRLGAQIVSVELAGLSSPLAQRPARFAA